MKAKISIADILNLLPHRYPFLLVDKVKSLDVDKKNIVAIKNVTFNEPHFTGHFPSFPVMPGVLIVEALAQSGGILAAKILIDSNKDKSVLLTTIENTKFKKVVEPGDVLELDVSIESTRNVGASIMCKFSGRALVDNKLAAEASFSALIKNNRGI